MVNQKEEFEKYPKIKQAYIHAFDKMLAERKKAGMKTEWETGEDVMSWWLKGEKE